MPDDAAPLPPTFRVENLTPDRPRRIVRYGMTKERAEKEAERLNGYGHDGEYVIGENLPDPYGDRSLYMVSSEADSVFSRCGTFASITEKWEKASQSARSEQELVDLRRAAVNSGRDLRRLGFPGVPATAGVIGAAQTTAELDDLARDDNADEIATRRALITG